MLLAQPGTPAFVFKSAIDDLRGKTRIPILLPSKLPVAIKESAIKLAYGEARKDGYFISLYYEEIGSGASYAAGFGGETSTFRLTELGNAKRVALSRGRIGAFLPVSCGGSCAPANLWWEENGATYDIQIKLRSDTPQRKQEKILVEVAKAIVMVH